MHDACMAVSNSMLTTAHSPNRMKSFIYLKPFRIHSGWHNELDNCGFTIPASNLSMSSSAFLLTNSSPTRDRWSSLLPWRQAMVQVASVSLRATCTSRVGKWLGNRFENLFSSHGNLFLKLRLFPQNISHSRPEWEEEHTWKNISNSKIFTW